MPIRSRLSIRLAPVLLLALAGIAAAAASAAYADSSSKPCPEGRTCKMDLAQLRVVMADHKIDWGASDYYEKDTATKTAGEANVATLPYTPTKDDDLPTASVPLPGQEPLAKDLTAAGAHPYLNIFLRYCDEQGVAHGVGILCNSDQGWARIRSLTLRLPPGMIGNPQVVPPCPWAILTLGVAKTLCAGSVVGVVRSWVLTGGDGPGGEQTPKDVLLYNAETIGGEPARLASDHRVDGNVPPLPIVFAARQRDGDVGIDSFTDNLPTTWGAIQQYLKIMQQDITLFPRLPVKYDSSQANYFQQPFPERPENEGGTKPFFTNPTSCGTKTVTLEARSWEEGPNATSKVVRSTTDGRSPGSDRPFEITGCDQGNPDRPSFDRPVSDPLGPDSPEVTTVPDDDEAGKPTGYTVKVRMPDTEDSEIHGTHLKSAKVTLPKGITLAAGGGKGLQGCKASEFDVDHPDDAVSCPPGSRIADVEVKTPLVGTPLSGGAFFATPAADAAIPTEDHPWKLYLLIEGSGNRIKLAGDVTIDQQTGQITTDFKNNPQVPFTELTLKLNGGDRAILQNPTGCGLHTGNAELKGWTKAVGEEPVTKDLTPSVTISNKCSDDPPFNPTVSANADDESAGASSPSHLGVERPDGNARLTKLQLALPSGLVGSLTTVPLCPAADVPAGTCPETTKIGSLTTTLGYGSATLQVPGSLYLGKGTEPGDAASLSAVIPSKIGPINFGNVVVVNHIKLRQSDGGLTATTDDVKKIPTIVGGIPIYAKRIQIDVDRPGFLTNPTGCDPRTLVGDFDSDNAKKATASVSLTATNCERLPFGPKLSMTALGETGRFQHPGLKAVVTQTAGEAAIKRAVVLLPETLRPELPTIQKSLCTTPQLNANACPPASIVGNATAYTPLLPEPLNGPVFLVQDPNINDPLPKIVVRLAGMVSIDLTARNTIEGVRTVNTFASIPDVPVTSFELNIKGGKPGILKNFYQLCDQPSRADATFTGQNGKVHVTRPLLKLPACATSAKSGPSIKTSTTTMSRKGVVSLKIKCGSAGCSTGKASIQTGKASAAKSLGSKSFSIGANKTKTVKIKLSKSGQKSVKKKRKLSAQAVVTVGATKVTKTIKIKAPKKKKRK